MSFERAIASWEKVNDIDPSALTDARLQAHWAAQIIGGVGEALVTPVPDFSHTSMSWVEGHRALVGQMTSLGARVGLILPEMKLIVIDDSSEIVDALDLSGQTLQQGLAWTIATLEKRGAEKLSRKPEIPTYDMPDHPVSGGEAFKPGELGHYEELSRWYANATRFETAVREQIRGASPVRCWPHHFDIATLISFDGPGVDPESARSIGFGLSPGDSAYDHPYFYINPWPFPDNREDAPSLEGGAHWHTEDWFGAVLPAGAIRGSREEQAKQVAAYVSSALEADQKILNV